MWSDVGVKTPQNEFIDKIVRHSAGKLSIMKLANDIITATWVKCTLSGKK